MPELRHDPITGCWVIIAENRAMRPNAFTLPATSAAPDCPFCFGQEAKTPAPTAIYPSDSHNGAWRVRVFPNKYPAVTSDETNAEAPTAYGRHEVIVESPDHLVSFSEVAEQDARLAFRAYQERLRAMHMDARLAFGLIFKNARPEGGASLEHTHSQLLACETVPPQNQFELARAGEYRALHGQCMFCEVMARELEGHRLVGTSEHFVALCPYASRFPYETWILPKTHRASFEEASAAELHELAELTQKIIRRLETRFEAPAYNFWIRTAPFNLAAEDDYHWHLEWTPRMTRLAGFELATGCFINPVSPEQAAEWLRWG